jgi:hypothetical protein
MPLGAKSTITGLWSWAFPAILGACCPVSSAQLPASAFSDLESREFSRREHAQAELLSWGRMNPGSAMPEFLRQSRHADDPEVRERCLTILRNLVTDEYMKEGEGYIGIALSMKDEILAVPGDPDPRNAIRVVEVRMDTPGQRAGIQLNDLIVGLEGEVWRGVEGSPLFREKIKSMKPNATAGLLIHRDKKVIELGVKLGRRPLMADAGCNQQNVDPEAGERAAKEAYFRRWLSQRKSQE